MSARKHHPKVKKFSSIVPKPLSSCVHGLVGSKREEGATQLSVYKVDTAETPPEKSGYDGAKAEAGEKEKIESPFHSRTEGGTLLCIPGKGNDFHGSFQGPFMQCKHKN